MLIGNMLQKPVHKAHTGTSVLVDDTAKVGIEIEVRGWKGRDSVAAEFAKYWEGKEDHSLRDTGREYVSRGGLVGKDLSDAIEAFYNVAESKKFNEGYPYAGIHLHLDCTEMDVESRQLARFVEVYMLAEPLLFYFAGDYRRNCGFCYALEQAQGDFPLIGRGIYSEDHKQLLDTLQRERRGTNVFSKYQAFNLKPLYTFGTIEIRHLPTTMDRTRLLDWVNIVLSLRKAAMTRETILEQALTSNPYNFLRSLFPDNLWAQIEGGFNEEKYWNAIDNIFALRNYASKAAKPALIEESESIWDSTGNNINAVVMSKFTNKPTTKATAKKARPVYDRVVPEAPRMPLPGDFANIVNRVFNVPVVTRTGRITVGQNEANTPEAIRAAALRAALTRRVMNPFAEAGDLDDDEADDF